MTTVGGNNVSSRDTTGFRSNVSQGSSTDEGHLTGKDLVLREWRHDVALVFGIAVRRQHRALEAKAAQNPHGAALLRTKVDAVHVRSDL
mmetsp:Transcript_36018/g.80969  ORF Transcript_36018/g.80969 Transcript_36018/m.80969 type:complete len:89 (-) Transcript_36018:680-946(-)